MKSGHLEVELLRVHTCILVTTSDGRSYFTGYGGIRECDIKRAYPGQWADLEKPGDVAHVIDYLGLFERKTQRRRKK